MRLIDAEALRERIIELKLLARDRVINTNTNSPCYARYAAQLGEREDLIIKIDAAPTIDAEPVVHGRWEVMLDYPGNDGVFVCSNCKEAWILNGGTPAQNNMNYCPRCGAKIDEKDGDDNASK